MNLTLYARSISGLSAFVVKLPHKYFLQSVTYAKVQYENLSMIFLTQFDISVPDDSIWLSPSQFGNLSVPHNARVNVIFINNIANLGDAIVEVSNIPTTDLSPIDDINKLRDMIQLNLKNFPTNPNQQVTFTYARGKNYLLKFIIPSAGIFTANTNLSLSGKTVELCIEMKKIIKLNEINFRTLGVGGLAKQVEELFTRVFLSRLIPKSLQEKLNIKHVRGVLLYGPPGCGKTRLARALVQNVNAEVTIINAGELISKYVGESSNNVGKLFEPAKKNPNKLFVLVFDECDAIFQERRSGDTGSDVSRQVVNRLLAEIDGVEQTSNIIIIGTTNRIDLIDSAILRSGRLEVQLKIPLPDENGRVEIFNIHTQTLAKNEMLKNDVDISQLAEYTRGFTGAEIESVVIRATQMILRENISFDKISEISKLSDENIKISQSNFILAIKFTNPQFGSDIINLQHHISTSQQLENLEIVDKLGLMIHDFLNSSENDVSNVPSVKTIIINTQKSRVPLIAYASHIAKKSDASFIRILEPTQFITDTSIGSINKLSQTFYDAYSAGGGVIILDRVDDMAKVSRDGVYYDNNFILALNALLHSSPQHVDRLVILITARRYHHVKMLGIGEADEDFDIYTICINDD